MSQSHDDQTGKPWGLIIIVVFFVLALIGPIVWQSLGLK